MIGQLSREQPSVSGRPPQSGPQPAHIVNFLPGEVEDFLFAPDASGSRGSAAVILYLVQGAAGLPFFAPTGGMFTYGYLVGFVPAAWVTGFICERGWDRSFHLSLVAMLTGNVVIYAFGLPWLASAYGLLGAGLAIPTAIPDFWGSVASSGQIGFLRGDLVTQAVNSGLLPFIPGDLIKAVLAAAALPGAAALVQHARAGTALDLTLGDH